MIIWGLKWMSVNLCLKSNILKLFCLMSYGKSIGFLKEVKTSKNLFKWETQETDLYLALISVTMTTNGLFKVISILAHWVNNKDKNGIKVEYKVNYFNVISHSNTSESCVGLRGLRGFEKFLVEGTNQSETLRTWRKLLMILISVFCKILRKILKHL